MINGFSFKTIFKLTVTEQKLHSLYQYCGDDKNYFPHPFQMEKILKKLLEMEFVELQIQSCGIHD